MLNWFFGMHAHTTNEGHSFMTVRLITVLHQLTLVDLSLFESGILLSLCI